MVEAKSKAKEMELQATIIRADGSIEELGVIAYWNVNPFKTILWRIKKWLQ